MSRTRTTVISLVLLILLMAAAASAQNFAAPWLKMGVGAKAMAMGTAQTAVVEDATAAYWNPAAMCQLHRFDVALMYTAGMKAERNYNYVSAAFRADRIGTFGISWVNAGITGIEKRIGPGPSQGMMDVSNNAFQLSYGRDLGRGFALGLSLKYLQENLADNNGYGVDAGLLFKPYDELQFGVMGRDISAKIGPNRVPYQIRLGMGVWPVKHLTLASDLILRQDQDATAALGTAYDVGVSDNTSFYLAAGMNDLLRESRGFTAGFGFNFSSFSLQYAYVTEPQDFLESNHKLSVNFFFGKDNPLRSLMGTLKREKKEECEMKCCPKEEGPKEFIHRYIFEGNPSLKLSLELLRPEQKDSIKTIWSQPGGIISFPGVNFATGSAEITDEFARVLDGAAQLINEHPEIQLLEIQGHTDNTGSDAINNPLSQARADAVRNYLISRGVDPNRLTAKGFGSSKPVASNATEQGKYQNRRIDIVRVR
jgi:outer membrane protein OmpA-like peptidoglycan-associated protein